MNEPDWDYCPFCEELIGRNNFLWWRDHDIKWIPAKEYKRRFDFRPGDDYVGKCPKCDKESLEKDLKKKSYFMKKYTEKKLESLKKELRKDFVAIHIKTADYLIDECLSFSLDEKFYNVITRLLTKFPDKFNRAHYFLYNGTIIKNYNKNLRELGFTRKNDGDILIAAFITP